MSKYESKILDIINTSQDHLTPEEIFLKLKEKEPKVVLATIYNNLNRLCDNGEINRLSISGQPDRYDKKIRHDHLVCTGCGSITDFLFPNLTGSIEKELGSQINGYDLKISYVCPKCKKQ